MGLYKTTPPISGRMGCLWCLSGIKGAAIIEYGCMGHMAYGRTFLHRTGSYYAKLYSTHISETDIAMGDTSRLIRAIQQVSETESINTIFLLPSSVPEVIGIDLNAIAKELAPRFPDTHLIPLPSNGFHVCGHKGIEQTLLHLVKAFSKDIAKTITPTFNIIGSCADMFAFYPDTAELIRLISGAFSASLLCTMTSSTSISELEKTGSAHFNIVIRQEGEAAAQYMLERFGTPYITARPYGIKGTLNWLEKVSERFHLQINKCFIRQEQVNAEKQIEPIQIVLARFLRAHKNESKLILGGHIDVISGIADYGKNTFGFEQTLCYSDCTCMDTHGIEHLTDETKLHLMENQTGFLMGSGELLRMTKRNQSLQISTPDNLWRHAYEPPLLGFRGAVHLATVWANEMMRKD